MSDDAGGPLLEADQWSRFFALFTALAVYVVVSLLLADALFGLLAAAFVGVGVRIYLQYHVSKANTEAAGSSLASHPMTGGYHYGAVGAALVVGPLVAVAAGLTDPGPFAVIGVGVAAGLVSFAALRVALPK